MERLTASDTAFLAMETENWHQHVGGLTILDTSSVPDFGFDDLRATLRERLPYAPKFRWKLRTVPMGLDRPVWVDDDDFDLSRHLHRIGVPAPGGARECAEVAGEILSRQLDRKHPLWEIWYLDGLAGDRVGIVMKYHHCLLDGIAGASLATVMMDLEPEPEPAADRDPPPDGSAGGIPSDYELVARAFLPDFSTPRKLASFAGSLARRGAEAIRSFESFEDLRSLSEALDSMRPGVPKVSFNGSVGPRRALSFSSVALDDVKRIRAAAGVTVNDVVLAMCGAAFRRYLDARGELPDDTLVAGVPVSTRSEGDVSMNNQVTTMQVALGTDIADPRDRLAAVHEASRKAKGMTEALGVADIQELGSAAPPLLLNVAIRTMASTGLLPRLPGVMNTIISNVPGPPFPLYTSGAKVAGIYSTSVLLEGVAANITLFSYEDRIDFGLHVDPDLVPDPWSITDELPRALAELLGALELGDPMPVEDAFGQVSTA